MFKKSVTFVSAAVLLGCALSAASPAAEWGSIKGRFVLDGAPPQLPPLVVTKDEFCIETKPKNESIVVGQNNGLANVVVYLRAGRGKKVEAHPDYAAKLSEPVVLDNKGCAFVPHIVLVRVGQPIEIRNSDPDPVGHNTNIMTFKFNQTIPAGGKLQIKAGSESPLPMPVVCGIHPWMQAHLLSQNHPYMTASSDDGSFEITNLPVGKHEFQFWHEAPGFLRNVKLKGGTTDRRGRTELTIVSGQTLDLGEIKVPASLLK